MQLIFRQFQSPQELFLSREAILVKIAAAFFSGRPECARGW
jgi:hypothetical protein